jgi:hypothetical protein
MHTAGYVTQGKPNTDAQIFISINYALAYNLTPGNAVALNNAVNTQEVQIPSFVPATDTPSLMVFNIDTLLLRLGMLQSKNYAANSSQQAFGTAEGPGPNSTSGTSAPSGFGSDSVIAPIAAANLPTLIGSVSGPPAKGIQLNYIDLVYQIFGNVLASFEYQVDKITIPPGFDQNVVISNMVPLGNVPLAFRQPMTNDISRFRISVPNPKMLVDDGDFIQVQVAMSSPPSSGDSLAFIGLFLGCSYNFN